LTKSFGSGVVLVAIVVTVLANAAGIVVPVLLPVLARTRGLTEAQAGLFAMAVYGGIGIGAMGCAVLPGLVERLNWRRTVALGFVAVIAANLAMVVPMGFFGLFVLALAAGVGAGLVNAVFYVISAEGGGARAVAAFLAAQIGFGAISVGFVSPIVAGHGEAGLFVALAALGGAGLLLCPLLPARSLAPKSSALSPASESNRISGLGWAAALGVFIFFVGQGASYGFLGYMGLAWGGTPAAIESAVSGIMFIGMVGPLVVVFVGSRFGYGWPLTLTIAGGVLGLALFITIKPTSAFLPIGGLLYFSLNTTPAYLFEVITDADHSTGAAMMMGASQLGGFAIGPAIAGYLVSPDYVSVNCFVLVSIIASSLIILGVILIHRHRENQFSANASIRLKG
jgi:hypothetical protein